MTKWGAGWALVASFWLACLSPLQAQVFVGDAINASLSGQPGDTVRGRALVLSRQGGLCILCHSGPFPEERFQGTLAPDLAASSAALSAEQLRARIVDASRFNPNTIMPSYFRAEGFTRIAPQFAGKAIEDVVAFLVSLKP